MYGLKQSPRCWNEKFSSILKQFNFKEIEADKSIFVGYIRNFKVILALFVDDGLLAAKSKEVLESVIEYFKRFFNITLGDCSKFVGVEIKRNRIEKSIFIHQSLYTKKIIDRFKVNTAKAVSTPSDPHSILIPVDPENVKECKESIVPYREAVGSLLFLAIVSRPDIAHAVNIVSKFLNNHNVIHWRAVKRIFAYLVGTPNYGIKYAGNGSDSD